MTKKLFTALTGCFLMLIIVSCNISNIIEKVKSQGGGKIPQLTFQEQQTDSIYSELYLKAGKRFIYKTIGLSGARLTKVGSTKTEDFYIFSFGSGGNACEESQALIVLNTSGDAFVFSDLACYEMEVKLEANGTPCLIYKYDSFRPPIEYRYTNGTLLKSGINNKNEIIQPEVRTTIHSNSKFSDVGEKYANKCAYELLSENQSAQEAFKKSLGKDFFELTDRLGVSPNPESSKISDDLRYYCDDGSKPHAGTYDRAIICLDLNAGTAYAAILFNGELVRYYGCENRESLPKPILTWIRNTKIKNVRKGP